MQEIAVLYRARLSCKGVLGRTAFVEFSAQENRSWSLKNLHQPSLCITVRFCVHLGFMQQRKRKGTAALPYS